MLSEKERNIAMICRKEMALSRDNMWLIVSVITEISASSLLLQTQFVFAVPNLATTPIKPMCIKRCCDCSKQSTYSIP